MRPVGSNNLKRAATKELFPAPVLPTMPICKEIQEGLRITNMQQIWEETLIVEDEFLKFQTLAPWKESYDIECIKKQRHHFAKIGPYSQSYGFYSNRVQM